MIIKISKYSIKSEAAIYGCIIKKLFRRVLKTLQKIVIVTLIVIRANTLLFSESSKQLAMTLGI